MSIALLLDPISFGISFGLPYTQCAGFRQSLASRLFCRQDEESLNAVVSFKDPDSLCAGETVRAQADFRICVTHLHHPIHPPPPPSPPPPSPPPPSSLSPCTNAHRNLNLSAPFGQCSSLQLWTANDYYSKGSVHVRPLLSIFTNRRPHALTRILAYSSNNKGAESPMQPSTTPK